MLDFNSLRLDKNKTQNEYEFLGVKEIATKDIAVIGMAAKLPQADTVADFWNHLMAGMDCIGDFPEQRKKDTDVYIDQSKITDNPKYFQGAYLQEIDKFDYSFFRLSPKEASLMSPQQRLFLETMWHTIEDAGYGGKKIIGSKTGVYLGFEADALYDYKRFIEELDPEALAFAVPGNLTPIIASRLSYLLDLKGPSMSVDSTCSSSLVAVHLACQAIRNGECESAIVGSVRINMLPVANQLQLGVESSDGRARTFDDDSDGTGSGEGVAGVFLKPLNKALNEGDHIYGVIKGSAVNQDGNSIGITAPNVLAQEDVIVHAWKDAGIDPETITYIEAHGTGTRLGDPIEIDGIQRAFRQYTSKKQFCAIGSVKTNIGHLDNAAGIVGLIKLLLMLKAKQIPPSRHFNKPNRRIFFEQSPVYVNDKLVAWEPGEFPRRCGISSFGFSGTNCHMVLEEAPITENGLSDQGLQIITLAAKSKKALTKLILAYRKYLNQDGNADLADICYTANTGRGHYNYRLALTVNGLDELKAKFIQLNPVDLILKDNQLFYGEHRVVPSHKAYKEDGDKTENEIKELSNHAKALIKKLIAEGGGNRDLFHEICQLYVMGAEIDWDQFYSHERRTKVSLPDYPFEDHRCWIEVNPKQKKRFGQKFAQPLLEVCIAESLNLEIYSTILHSEKNWVVKEHKIMGKSVLVGSSFLEMAVEAVRNRYSYRMLQFKDIIFCAPLIINDGEQREIQLLLKKENDFFAFSVISKLETNDVLDPWIIHAEGKIITGDTLYGKEHSYDPVELQRKHQNGYMVPSLDNYNKSSVFGLGPHWDNIKEMYVGESELLSYLELPEEFRSELKDYSLHPSLLDNALTTMPLLQKHGLASNSTKGAEKIFLPFSYQSITVYHPLPARFYSYVRMKDAVAPNNDLISFDIILMDVKGEIICEIEDYTLKRIHTNQVALERNEEAALFHKITWVAQEPALGPVTVLAGTTMILNDEKGLGDRLAQCIRPGGNEVIMVETGPTYQKVNRNRYLIHGCQEDYERLINDLGPQKINTIFHLQTLTKHSPKNIEEFQAEQFKGVKSLFYLIKALMNQDISQRINLILVAEYVNEVTGLEEIINSEKSTLFGLGKVIGKEYANLRCKCIDIDGDINIETLIAESAIDPYPTSVAYRNGKRYIEEFRRFDLTTIPNQEISIKNDGVYIITGGTGGIGLEIGRFLASNTKVNLAFINRSKFPERTEWDEIQRNGDKPKLSKQIEMIGKIEANGSKVWCYTADVSAMSQILPVFDELRQRFHRINGLIHSAGVAGDGFIFKKSDADFEQVLSPKVQGTWLLNQITAQDALDFFIMFSSVTTLSGIPGQGDYTSANAFLDSFAAYRKRQSGKTLTINWAGWKETGMSYDYDVNTDAFFKILSTATAITAFEKVFHKNINRVYIGRINLNHPGFQDPHSIAIQLSAEISADIHQNAKIGVSKFKDFGGKVQPKGKKYGDYSETEIKLTQIFGEMLGHQTIDIQDNFYELGADSLFVMKIVNSIQKNMGIELGVSTVFKYATITELAQYLDENSGRSGKNGTDYPPIQKVAENNYYPVSSAQKRVFIANQLNETDISYNIPFAMFIEGKFDKNRIENTLQTIVTRHESLRTSFEVIHGEIVQKVHHHLPVSITNYESENGDFTKIRKNFVKPFYLGNAPLFRIGIVKLAEERHILLIDIHHIITDATSNGILMKEFIHLYMGKALPELHFQYRDFAVWHNRLLTSKTVQKQMEYWLQKLDHFTFTELPKKNEMTGREVRGINRQLKIESSLKIRIDTFCKENKITKFVFFFGLLKVIIFKEIHQNDICIGIPVADRKLQELENLIGLFLNVLAIRSIVDTRKPVKEFMNELKTSVMEAQDNQDYPYENLYMELKNRLNFKEKSIFSIFFNFLPFQSNHNIALDDITIKPYKIWEMEPKYDLILYIDEIQSEFMLNMTYKSNLYDDCIIERILRNFEKVIAIVLAQPDINIGQIELNEDIDEQGTVDFSDYLDNEEFLP